MDMKTELLELPARIKEKELEILEKMTALEELKTDISVIENKIGLAVRTEPDLKNPGKMQFTNDFLRDAETNKRLADDVEFHDKTQTIAFVRNSKELMEIELKFLYNSFSALKAISRTGNLE